MATAKKKQEPQGEIIIDKLSVGEVSMWVKGQTPLIYNAMSNKVLEELLFPKGKKTAGQKATTMKHEPLEEYRNSVYRRSGKGATRITFPAVAFKNAAVGAIRHLNAGVTMVQMRQLLWVPGDTIDVYGVPKMLMSVVRSADMKRTPDVRTRAILPEWCCKLTMQFTIPNISETSVARVIEAGGILNGVGDFRQEKGKGNYGQFCLCDEADVKDLVKSGGIAAQDKALKSPEYYDTETETLYNWFLEERKKRGR